MPTDCQEVGWKPTAAVLAVCAALLAPTLTFRFGLDQGVFAYMGAAILEGRWPYVDTWDHAFPGAMVLHALVILIGGKSIVFFRLFDLLFQLAVAGLIFRITTAVASRVGGFVGAVTYVLIYQSYGPWNTAQREGFGLLFLLLGFWLYLTADRRRPVLTAAGIGLGLGIAVIIKPTLLAFAVLYVPLLRQLRWRHGPLLAAAAAGLLLPSLLVIAFYAALGALRPLYEACIAYQLEVYVHRLRGDQGLLLYWLGKLGRLGWQTVGLGLAYLPFLFMGPARPARRMLYLGYLAAVFTVFVQGTFAGYHYLPGLGFGAVLIGSLFTQVADRLLGMRAVRLGGRQRSARFLLALGVIVAALPLYLDAQRLRDLVSLHFLAPPRPGELRILSVFDYTESHDLAAYLAAHTTPEEPIQIWGHESLVYYLAERHAASRFQTSNPLVMRVPGQDITPMQQRWRQEFMFDLQAHPPAYIAVTRDDHWWWAPDEQSSQQLLDDFPAWKASIANGYTHENTIGRFLVYRRNGAGQP